MYSLQMKLLLLCVVLSFAAGPAIGEQEHWRNRKLEQSYDRALQAYHPHPAMVVSHFNEHVHRAFEESNGNNTRRGLRKIHLPPSACIAENPIDHCWRCREDWASNRKLLAHCAIGFGRNTTGGKDGPFYTVTSNSDSDLVEPKPGTLRYGTLQPGPLWIIFACDMVIRLKGELLVTSDKTIDGRGAKIDIAHGHGIIIEFANNVIISNIKVHDTVNRTTPLLMRHTADVVGVREQDDGDGVSMFASTNVWIDHLSMWNCKDGLIDAVKASTAITISNCHLARHNDVMLFGANDTDPNDKVMQITIAFNHFGKGLIQRMPRCRWGFFHVVNNDYTHWLMYAIGGTSQPTIISQGNRFTAPPDPRYHEITCRNNGADVTEWKKWTWKSERDLMRKGAFFVESGPPFNDGGFKKGELIEPRGGEAVLKLCKDAGYLRCRKGKKC